MPIKWKFTALCFLIASIALLAIGSYFIWRLEDFYKTNLDTYMLNEALIVSELLTSLPFEHRAPANLDAICKRIGQSTAHRLTLIAPNGTVLADSLEDPAIMENHLDRPEVQQALVEGQGTNLRFSTTIDVDMHYIALTVPDQSSDSSDQIVGIVRIAVPLSEINRSIGQLRFILMTGIAIALTISIILGRYFAGTITNPLAEVGKVATKLARGSFDHTVSYSGNDELGVLAGRINDMGAALKRNVQQLSLEKRRLETVVSSMTGGVILCDGNGRIELINESTARMFGVNSSAVHGLSVAQAFRNFLLTDRLDQVMTSGSMESFELNLFHPEPQVLQAHIIPVQTEHEHLAGILVTLHDITGIRSMEKMRSEFATSVSHELLTPLTTIKGYAETLIDLETGDTDSVNRIAATIDREAGRLARLVNSILNLARLEGDKSILKKRKVDLPPVATRALTMLQQQASAKEQTLESRIQPNLPAVHGDPDWLLQLLLDLLDNAVKYTPKGGHITLTIEVVDKQIAVVLSDTGIGISAESLPHIFERFYRADKARSRSGGAGLGLAVVKHIVDAHGGTISVDSSLGRGTTFKVLLPTV